MFFLTVESNSSIQLGGNLAHFAPPPGVFLGLGVSAHFASKIIRDLLKLTNILNYNKSSCITGQFCVKLF